MKILIELYSYRQMIFSLIKRDLRGRYKGSVLGFLWTFINPLFQLMIYTFVFSNVLKSNIEDFHIFLFVALVPWIFFSTCLSSGSSCIWIQQDMVKKIYFPREVLPIAYVTSQFINMLFSFIVIFIVILFSGRELSPIILLYLPVVFFVEYLLSLGITMLFSSLTVYFRDLEYILGIVSMAWLYLTPILYSEELIPKFIKPIYSINPMTSIVAAYRDILYYNRAPRFDTIVQAFLLGSVILVIGSMAFSKLKKHFVEEL